jgi:hypothetical protein
MPSQNVRISESAYRILRTLAKMDNISMQAALDRVLEEQQRKVFLTQANAAFAALKGRPKEWREEQDERELWMRTLADGMER